jgi:hypothetical protein
MSKQSRPPKSQKPQRVNSLRPPKGNKKLKEQKLQDHPRAIQLEKTKISQPSKSKNKSKNPHFHANTPSKKCQFLTIFV